MFKTNTIYKHRNFMDACFKVGSVQSVSADGVSLKVYWYRQTELQPMGFDDTIFVKTKDFEQYKELG